MAYTTIDNPELYFQCKKWAGNNSGSGQAITLDGDEDMQPDLVWVKSTDNTHAHVLYDSVRTSPAKYLLQTNTNIAERTATIGSFDSDGVTFSDNDGFYNGSDNYVGWFWKESADAGMDIVSYTGNATNRTISHSLSAVPHWIIIKNRESTSSSAEHWLVYHKSISNTHGLLLNQTDAKIDDATYFQDTDPTSSVFSIGTADRCNKNSEGNISYLFSEKQGFSKFGSFEGNNNADGSFVYLGFKPAWIIIKDIDSSNTVGGSAATSWGIWDNKRMPANPASNPLWANQNGTQTIRGNNSSANTGGTDGNGLGGFIHLDMLSNGFKCRCATGELNDAQTYVYMAFAEAPFVNSNGVPCNAR